MSDVNQSPWPTQLSQILAERQRLAAREAERAQAAEAHATLEATVVSRDTFLAEAAYGTPEQRQDLLDRFDQDGIEGFSEAEFDAAFASMMGTPDLDALSKGVADDLQQALQDDRDTLQDLTDAAGHVTSASDAQAILDVAARKGLNAGDQLKVVQALVRHLDEEANEVNPAARAVYAAIASGFDRLGEPGLGDALRGSVEAAPGVREKLLHAIQDGKDTVEDLGKAARRAKTPADLALVLDLQRALAQGDPHQVLQEALKGLDESDADLVMMNAIAAEYRRAGNVEYAQLVTAAANPNLSKETRKHLIHALQDDKNTAADIRKAFRKSDAPIDSDASMAVGTGRLGEEHTGLLAVTGLYQRYDKALKAVQDLEPTLQMGLAALEGASQERKEAFVAAFKDQHADVYSELEDAKAALTKALTSSEADVVAYITGEKALEQVDPVALAKSLALIADTPEGYALATAVTEALAGQLEALASQPMTEGMDKRVDVYQAMLDHVLPVMVTRAGTVGLELGTLQGVPPEVKRFLEALSQVKAPEGSLEDWATRIQGQAGQAEGYVSHIDSLEKGLEVLDVDGAQRSIEKLTKIGSRLGTALGAIGLAAGSLAFVSADMKWQERVEQSIKLAEDGTSLVSELMTLTGRARKSVAAVEVVSGMLGTALDAWAAIQGFARGDWVGASVNTATTVLGVLGATTAIPGLGVASFAIGLGYTAFVSVQQQAKLDRMRNDVEKALVAAGYAPGYADFLAHHQPGTAQRVQETLGVTEAELSAFLEEHPDWSRVIDRAADPAFVRDLAPQLMKPGEDLLGMLGRLGEGLGPEDEADVVRRERSLEVLVDGLVVLAHPAPGPMGTPMSNAERASSFLSSYGTDPTVDRDVWDRMGEVVRALG